MVMLFRFVNHIFRWFYWHCRETRCLNVYSRKLEKHDIKSLFKKIGKTRKSLFKIIIYFWKMKKNANKNHRKNLKDEARVTAVLRHHHLSTAEGPLSPSPSTGVPPSAPLAPSCFPSGDTTGASRSAEAVVYLAGCCIFTAGRLCRSRRVTAGLFLRWSFEIDG